MLGTTERLTLMISLLSIRGAAIRLGLSSAELQQLVSTGAIPCVMLPMSVVPRFDPVDLAAWVKQFKQPETAEGAETAEQAETGGIATK